MLPRAEQAWWVGIEGILGTQIWGPGSDLLIALSEDLLGLEESVTQMGKGFVSHFNCLSHCEHYRHLKPDSNSQPHPQSELH